MINNKIDKLIWVICGLALLWLLLWTSGAIAARLVCDPQAGVESYMVYQDGNRIAEYHPAQADGSLDYDLTGVAPGVYTFTAEACNAWGCSDPSDPFVSPDAAGKPTNLNLIP